MLLKKEERKTERGGRREREWGGEKEKGRKEESLVCALLRTEPSFS